MQKILHAHGQKKGFLLSPDSQDGRLGFGHSLYITEYCQSKMYYDENPLGGLYRVRATHAKGYNVAKLK